jgi:hypothetical protein
MKTGMIIGGIVLMIIAGSALCAEELNSDLTLTNAPPPQPRYRGNEFSVDAFGGMTLGQSTLDLGSGVRTQHDARLGLGTGVNYFFTPNIGVAAEGFTEDPHHSFVDTADGSMVFRLPFGKSGFAAYLFGGGGHQFDPNAVATFHTGGGLEYRFSQHFGTFLEPRIVFKQGHYGFGKCGVRWNF